MDIEQALVCARLSQAIYLPLNDFHNQLRDEYPGCRVQIFQRDGCECACLCLPKEKKTILIFRGTEFSTSNDFLANMDVVRDQDPLLGKVYVHSGFLAELKDVWKQLYTFVDTHARPHYHQLFVTGHSLGGALALLCSARLSSCFIMKVDTYSFGAPMVGGSTFLELFDHTPNWDHYRCEYNNDIVPKLKTLRVLGYDHVGTKVYFNYTGDIILRELTWKERWRDWIVGHWQAVTHMQLFDSLKDHRITKYVQILDQNIM